MQQYSISLYAGFIEKGIFHYTCVDCNGKEHIVGYAFENEFVCDYSSFMKKTESLVSIRALTECTVYLISLNDYLEYLNTLPNGMHFGVQVANELLEMCYKRLLALYCENPEQRYISLIKQCPELKEKVPLKEIASFWVSLLKLSVRYEENYVKNESLELIQGFFYSLFLTLQRHKILCLINNT